MKVQVIEKTLSMDEAGVSLLVLYTSILNLNLKYFPDAFLSLSRVTNLGWLELVSYECFKWFSLIIIPSMALINKISWKSELGKYY